MLPSTNVPLSNAVATQQLTAYLNDLSSKGKISASILVARRYSVNQQWVWTCQRGAADPQHSPDALSHRFDYEAIYRDGDPAVAASGQIERPR